MTVTRTKLNVCREPDCHFDEETHQAGAWCRGIPDVPHSEGYTHQHWPRRSQGGREVVALLCAYCHDRIDNADWGNAVLVSPRGLRIYRAWDITNATLIQRVLTESGTEAGFLGAHVGSIGEKSKPTDVAASHPAPVSDISAWAERGRQLRQELETMQRGLVAVAFSVGDWVNEGEDGFGQAASQFIDGDEGWSYWNIAKWASIARRIAPENRTFDGASKLTLEHYVVAARLDDGEQREALETAVVEGESAAAMKARVAPSEQAEYESCPTCGQRTKVKPEHQA